MRFMMLMIPRQGAYENGGIPSPDQLAEMMKYNNSLAEAGVLISLDGLQPPAMGARVHFSQGNATVTDGPFAETKEVLGGYWMIKVGSRSEALAWAASCPGQDGDTIEVRQVFEMSDFPADVQDAAAAEISPNLISAVESARSESTTI
jgi:hypothetical protein